MPNGPKARFRLSENSHTSGQSKEDSKSDTAANKSLLRNHVTASSDEEIISAPLKLVSRRRTKSEREATYFQMINDRVVDDITVDVLYKPHTLTVLGLFCVALLYFAFTGEGKSAESNMWNGFLASLFLFLIVSALAFPNGPFIRPHPLVWRIIFGLSVVYMVILQYCLFLSYDQIKAMMSYLDPSGLSKTELVEKEYAINCSNVTLERIWSHMDIFAIGHFTGWAMKAMLIRHGVICWYISIAWEVTEVVFTHLLPNFQECWWDAIILDVLVCNGLGIFCGLKICEFLEMRTFHWESVKEIKSARGKLKRAVLQFTPESWTKVDWFTTTTLKRALSMYVFVMLWLLCELNTFFLKHIFAIDTTHPVVFWRLILIALISAPSIRQYYAFATDPRVKRLGMQSWVYLAVCALEAAICIKEGRHQFPAAQLSQISVWIFMLFVGTFGALILSSWWANNSKETRQVKIGGLTKRQYMDSSYENLGLIEKDVSARLKDLGVKKRFDYSNDFASKKSD